MESPGNLAEYSVSDISAAVKRTVEDAFGYVRVRGEISGFRGPHSSGHCYFALKDERARIEAVVWRSALQKLKFKPEDGAEVIATGRITTFAGQSKYQIVIEALEPAGVGALMALLEERRKKLAAEGLFDTARKQALPFLPRTIGVVTSPTGAVIRDILHRLDDRFPTRVVVWPVRVQGETAAAEVAAAIAGFSALPDDGTIARPDVVIVARGGGSLEDLWSFNDEAVVRAAAASTIPLISAVGHETDVTLIDHAADRRAPTPTAAAEMAVPVRAELVASVDGLAVRLYGGTSRQADRLRQALAAAARVLPRPDDVLADRRRELDGLAGRIALALQANQHLHRAAFERISPRLAPERLSRLCDTLTEAVASMAGRLARASAAAAERRAAVLERVAGLLEAYSYRSVLERGFALVTDDDRKPVRAARDAPGGTVLGIMFHDGEVTAVSRGAPAEPRRRRRKPTDGEQGSLL